MRVDKGASRNTAPFLLPHLLFIDTNFGSILTARNSESLTKSAPRQPKVGLSFWYVTLQNNTAT